MSKNTTYNYGIPITNLKTDKNTLLGGNQLSKSLKTRTMTI